MIEADGGAVAAVEASRMGLLLQASLEMPAAAGGSWRACTRGAFAVGSQGVQED